MKESSSRIWGGLGAAIALMALGSLPLEAASSQIWKSRTRSEREQGDLKGVSLAAEGTLSLVPAVEMLSSAADPYLWSVARDSRGILYAGTGTQGKVYRISPAGKGEVFLDTDETHIRALALTKDGKLLAGTDGKGMVLSVDPAGKSTVLSNAPLPEVTALVAGDDGRIYFAA